MARTHRLVDRELADPRCARVRCPRDRRRCVGLGIVLACFTLGSATFTLAGGVWADRLPRRAVMISSDLVRLGTQSTTAVLLLIGSAHVWELAALQFTAGAAGGFFNPASTASRGLPALSSL